MCIVLTWLATTTARYDGKGSVGGETLLPRPADHPAPQAGGPGLASKPLKLGGADPPLRLLTLAHCAPQNVTVPAGSGRRPRMIHPS